MEKNSDTFFFVGMNSVNLSRSIPFPLICHLSASFGSILCHLLQRKVYWTSQANLKSCETYFFYLPYFIIRGSSTWMNTMQWLTEHVKCSLLHSALRHVDVGAAGESRTVWTTWVDGWWTGSVTNTRGGTLRPATNNCVRSGLLASGVR